jgi:hypothetical protein
MNLSFLPNSDMMRKEIEHWIELRKLDTLLGVCNCCMYKVFDFILTQECRTCTVRNGILRIVEEKRREARNENAALEAC